MRQEKIFGTNNINVKLFKYVDLDKLIFKIL